jgi:hypothetical protein
MLPIDIPGALSLGICTMTKKRYVFDFDEMDDDDIERFLRVTKGGSRCRIIKMAQARGEDEEDPSFTQWQGWIEQHSG